MKIKIIIVILLTLSSCYKNEEDNYTTKIDENDEHKVEVYNEKYTKGGVLDSNWSK